MDSGVCFTFSELFDRHPTVGELIETVRGIPLKHAVHVILAMNLFVRFAMQENRKVNFGRVQEFLTAGHVDDETLGLLKSRFPTARCEDRPIFLPQNILAILRIAIANCDPAPEPDETEDARVRYAVGRACLMMNDLLFTPADGASLNTGTEAQRRVALMAQTIGGFELTNPTRPDHLMPRLHIMFRILLNDPNVRSRISQRCRQFDFLREFESRVGISVERWVFVVFSIWAYFENGADQNEPRPEFMLLNPSIFRGESGITPEELGTVLGTISSGVADLHARLATEAATDPRQDFVAFRSKPLLCVDGERLHPVDLSFIADKCHAGVQWALHDLLPSPKLRQDLFNAWGSLFEEYVHWLLTGIQSKSGMQYVPRPRWKRMEGEALDGVLIQGDVFAPLECKGGFLSREARYSGKPDLLLEDIDKKFAIGCDQLAQKIRLLFADSNDTQQDLEGVSTARVRVVLPILVLQDHILRVPLLNWYLNSRFRTKMRPHAIRAGVSVRSLTVICIQDLESAVHTIEGDGFDFIYAIHNRAITDPNMLLILGDFLRCFTNYGRSPSPRIKKVLETIQADWSRYLFPNHDPSSTATLN
ncbi:MAG: hypothetical protein ACLQG3_05835 [Terracidiphilus sp.]